MAGSAVRIGMTLDSGGDAELAEMLQFLHDWLAADTDRLGESLSGFVGSRLRHRRAAGRPQPVCLSCSVATTVRRCSDTNPSSGWVFMVVLR